jgi:hypothetical protein
MVRTLPLLLASIVLAAGCSLFEPGAPVVATPRPPELEITNNTAAPVYTTVFDRGFLVLALWAPCTDPARCPAIAPHTSSRLRYQEIGGYGPQTTEAVVYWWHLVRQPGGGFAPDEIRAIVVRL